MSTKGAWAVLTAGELEIAEGCISPVRRDETPKRERPMSEAPSNSAFIPTLDADSPLFTMD
jgi:hypothetical protein